MSPHIVGRPGYRAQISFLRLETQSSDESYQVTRELSGTGARNPSGQRGEDWSSECSWQSLGGGEGHGSTKDRGWLSVQGLLLSLQSSEDTREDGASKAAENIKGPRPTQAQWTSPSPHSSGPNPGFPDTLDRHKPWHHRKPHSSPGRAKGMGRLCLTESLPRPPSPSRLMWRLCTHLIPEK